MDEENILSIKKKVGEDHDVDMLKNFIQEGKDLVDILAENQEDVDEDKWKA